MTNTSSGEVLTLRPPLGAPPQKLYDLVVRQLSKKRPTIRPDILIRDKNGKMVIPFGEGGPPLDVTKGPFTFEVVKQRKQWRYDSLYHTFHKFEKEERGEFPWNNKKEYIPLEVDTHVTIDPFLDPVPKGELRAYIKGINSKSLRGYDNFVTRLHPVPVPGTMMYRGAVRLIVGPTKRTTRTLEPYNLSKSLDREALEKLRRVLERYKQQRIAGTTVRVQFFSTLNPNQPYYWLKFNEDEPETPARRWRVSRGHAYSYGEVPQGTTHNPVPYIRAQLKGDVHLQSIEVDNFYDRNWRIYVRNAPAVINYERGVRQVTTPQNLARHLKGRWLRAAKAKANARKTTDMLVTRKGLPSELANRIARQAHYTY